MYENFVRDERNAWNGNLAYVMDSQKRQEEAMTRGGGGRGELPMKTRYTCAPRVIRKIKENFALVIGRNKKNFEILPLKRVKFEIFARVIG